MFNDARKLSDSKKTTFLFGRLGHVFCSFEGTAGAYSLLLRNAAAKECVDFFMQEMFSDRHKDPCLERDSQAPVPLSSPSANRSCLCGHYKIDTLLENFL